MNLMTGNCSLYTMIKSIACIAATITIIAVGWFIISRTTQSHDGRLTMRISNISCTAERPITIHLEIDNDVRRIGWNNNATVTGVFRMKRMQSILIRLTHNRQTIGEMITTPAETADKGLMNQVHDYRLTDDCRLSIKFNWEQFPIY